MSLKWAVVFVGDDNKERVTVFNSDQCYFSTSVCVRWYSHDLSVAGIKRLRFYAARPVFTDANDQPVSNRFVCSIGFVVEDDKDYMYSHFNGRFLGLGR